MVFVSVDKMAFGVTDRWTLFPQVGNCLSIHDTFIIPISLYLLSKPKKRTDFAVLL